jgi:hypothetical protein
MRFVSTGTRYALASFILMLWLSSCQAGSDIEATETSSPALPASPTAIHATATPLSTAISLDLQEANVLGVVYRPVGQGGYRFDVTLIHDDDGESPSFADRWVIEDEDGTMLGERVLLHAHGSQPFTRSATIKIPSTVRVVIIRGHDQRHGFGGQAIVLDLETGKFHLVQDAEGP